ncbi:unnamed protein product [Adineta steineri]|uniref:Replication-associated protein n=1 Tax=Adineta steineri TaxID=433720 RepID=A0A816CQA0_9BILA|nr:unnamed protein product [Adineta steineri]CAF1626319.1 unnamed protein product [Adineta steineri]
MEQDQNIKSNVTNLEKDESLKNVSQNKNCTDRPTTLNTTTSNTSPHHNIRRYNIDDIRTTPSPIDQRYRMFQAGSIISPTTFARVETTVYNKINASEQGSDDDDDDENNEYMSNETNANDIEHLTQLIIREKPKEHNEVADALMDLLQLVNSPIVTTTASSMMTDTNDNNIDQTPEMIITSSSSDHPYPPINQTGIVTEHDRPYADYGHLNIEALTEECQFNVDIYEESNINSTKQQSSIGKKRLSTKTYAITAWTNVSKDIVMAEIKRKFGVENIQYICVGYENSPKTNNPHLHIQIILREKRSRQSGFLDQITNTHCNYQITENDRAWNEYIKKGGDYIEFNSFKSTTKWGTQYWPSQSSSSSVATSNNIPLQSTITAVDLPSPPPPPPPSITSIRTTTAAVATTTVRGRAEEQRKQKRAIARHAFNLAKTSIRDALQFMLENSDPLDFLKYSTWYKNTFSVIYLLYNDTASPDTTVKEYTWPESFPDCTPTLRDVVNQWYTEEFVKTSRAKCLILIGGTGTGKTSFAKSLPGQYNYFQGRWRLDSWKNSAHYLIFDDIPWDQFEQLGFPSKKGLLTQNGLTMATDKYRPSTKINIRQPAIVLLNDEDAGSLIAQPPLTVEQQQTFNYWQHRAIIYHMGPDEYFHKPDYYQADNINQ